MCCLRPRHRIELLGDNFKSTNREETAGQTYEDSHETPFAHVSGSGANPACDFHRKPRGTLFYA